MAKKQNKIRLTVQYRGGYRDRAGREYTEMEGMTLLRDGRATLTQWKGGKRARPADTPGRKAGVPNLKKTATGYINQYGVEFTQEQKKTLERAVNRSNYRRNKMLNEYDTLNSKNAGLRQLGKEPDFIISKQGKSLQQFKSMEDYEKFLDKQARIQSGEYLDDMTRLYKRNHMKALENVFGDEAKDVIMKIRMMPPEQYREMIDKDEFLEVSYVYDPSARTGKLNQIRASMGMKLKEEDMEEPE